MTALRNLFHFSSMQRGPVLVVSLLVTFLLTGTLRLFTPAPVRAHFVGQPVQVGISFSPERAEALGLDYRASFRRLESMHFRVIRLSAYWDEVDAFGYGELDWLMAEAARNRQPVALSVGMKGPGWPEFFIPSAAEPVPAIADGGDIASDPELRDAALLFVEDTVARYRGNHSLIAWQVENEPFNRAGPHRWWIGAGFLGQEVSVVKALDQHRRPVIVNAFSHFNIIFDQASNRDGFSLKRLLGFDADAAERDSLAQLRRNDILGLDVYTAIGYRFLGQSRLSHADGDWPEQLGRLRQQAVHQGKRAWITEAQAEPWEADVQTYTDPRSTSPRQIRELFGNLKDAGYGTILLWGSEYWLWRDANGDGRWVQTVQQILHQEAKAPAFSPVP